MRSRRMPRRRGPFGEHDALLGDAVTHLDLQLRGPRGDDGVRLGRQDQHGDARLAQPGDAVAVAAADAHELAALGVDPGGVVGVHAVEVGDDGVDVDAGASGVGEHRRGRRGGADGPLGVADCGDTTTGPVPTGSSSPSPPRAITRARARSAGSSISIACASGTRSMPMRPKKRWPASRNPSVRIT